MFRRHNIRDLASQSPETDSPEATPPAAKGRPTPKRREAEQARKQRVKPPLTKREAMKQDRQRTRQQRARTRQAMASGDERYFLKRDQGPVRKFIRDYVDSRRTVAEFFLPIIFIILLSSFVAIDVVQIFSTLLMLVTLVAIAIDLTLLNTRIKREARRRFPDDDQRGHGLYAIARASQMRKLRLPKPAVRPGDRI